MASYGSIPEDEVVVKQSGWKSFCRRVFPSGYGPECRGLVSMAWPMVLTQLFQFSVGLVATIFCGHLGKIQLDAVALANTLINTTGISVAVGLSAACDTCFSQIYGSENKKNLGVYFQRGLITIALVIFPCWAIHLNAEGLLLVLGQDPQVSRLAGRYMLIFMPGCLCFFIYISMSKYLQCQDIIFPNLIIGLVSNVIGAVAHYILLYPLQMSTDGSAIAQVCAYFSMLLFTVVYILWSKAYVGTWDGWSFACLQGWGEFYKLGIFGLLMIGIEWWSFEIGTFLTGVLGTTELAAQTVIFQLENVCYMLPLGVGISASIRVGQYLGNGDADAAKTSSRVAITIIWITGLIMAVLLASLRSYLPLIFTNVPEVSDLASSLLPILAVYMVFDSSAGVCAGILRGSGRQNIGSLFVFLAYTVALSVGIPLMFLTSLRVAGFWLGLAGALIIESTIFLIIVGRTDWQKQVEKAQERTYSGHENAHVRHSSVTSETGKSEAPTERTGLLDTDREVGGQTTQSRESAKQKNSHFHSALSGAERRRLVCVRLVTAALLVSVFVAALLVRLFVPLPTSAQTVAGFNCTTSTVSPPLDDNATALIQACTETAAILTSSNLGE